MEFETTKDIFLAIADVLQERIAQRVVEQMQADEPPRARLLALDEVRAYEDYWMEWRAGGLMRVQSACKLGIAHMYTGEGGKLYTGNANRYGIDWRIWADKPTEADMANEPWSRLRMDGDLCRACRADRLRKLMDDMQAISNEALGIMREAAEILAEIDDDEGAE